MPQGRLREPGPALETGAGRDRPPVLSGQGGPGAGLGPGSARVLFSGLIALLLLGAGVGPAAAGFTIRTARIAEGDLRIQGDIDEPDTAISLDGSFTETSDGQGRFEFRIPYHPATCTVLLNTKTQSRAVVVENCGQRGPPGPPGPAGTEASSAAPGPASAPGPGTAALEATGVAGAACGPKAARYAGENGLALWVTRQGTMSLDNPLRPSSTGEAVVLQVTIQGKVATAYGPSVAALLRGGPPQQLEAETGQPIKWRAALGEMPASLQIVADDQTAVLGKFEFKECATPPKAPATTASQGRRAPAGAAAPGALPPGLAPAPGEGRPPLRMPRGAIDESVRGPGLTVPRLR